MNHSMVTPSPGVSGKYGIVAASDKDMPGGLGTTVDFSSVDDMDPSLADGHHVYFEREVPFELRLGSGGASPGAADGDAGLPGSLEAIKVKILLRGVESCPESVRVELSSEADLFFHYMHEVRDRDYRDLQERQGLMVDFGDYASVLVRMLNQVRTTRDSGQSPTSQAPTAAPNTVSPTCALRAHERRISLCLTSRVRAKTHPSSPRDRKLCTPSSHLSQCIKEPHSHLALFTIGGSKASNPAAARLEFIQNMEYKFIELLSLDFSASVEHTVRQQITYRYNANKVRPRCLHPRMRSLYHQ